ncbi:MAG: tripartite tricarboxylate transporter TctB family protein [Halobacteria archaeon]|nr:tripartite tricarboxylate transporter TctB family protein [Halobacteria archaeon]
MRRAEIIMAIVMAIFSLSIMYKSTELPTGWIAGEGPGGGAWPFWLATGMFLSCVWIIVRWFRRSSPPSRSTEPYMDKRSIELFLLGAGSLTVMIGLIHLVGVYGSVPLFLIFYMRVMGRHPWRITGALAGSIPIVTFFFFEIALRITLPKGYTEPLFYPLYDIFL